MTVNKHLSCGRNCYREIDEDGGRGPPSDLVNALGQLATRPIRRFQKGPTSVEINLEDVQPYKIRLKASSETGQCGRKDPLHGVGANHSLYREEGIQSPESPGDGEKEERRREDGGHDAGG